MKRFQLPSIALFLALLSCHLAAQSASDNPVFLPHEPAPNLGELKRDWIAYHDCKGGKYGCYTTDLDHQCELAILFLQQRVAHASPGEKLALVLDIDETALSNWPELKQDDFGYIETDWENWVAKADAPAIEGTLRLYREAVRSKVSVFFITSRKKDKNPIKDQTTATSDSLKAAGYEHWDGLALRGAHAPDQTVTEYKSGERQKIVSKGYRIILNVGDQMSDLNGDPHAERSIKLPNPFYYIP